MRTAIAHTEDDDFIQPGTLYRQVMSPTDRDHLVEPRRAPQRRGGARIQERAVKHWSRSTPTWARNSPPASGSRARATYVPEHPGQPAEQGEGVVGGALPVTEPTSA